MISAALGAALCAGLLLGPLAGCQKRDGIPTVDASQLTVTPPSQTDGMIPTDAQFSVGFGDGKKISARQAEKIFRFEPSVEFTAESADGGLLLTPKTPFPENSIVNLQILDTRGDVQRSFAYQTWAGFAVDRTTPNDGVTYVPTDTGIEVKFTYPTVTEEAFADAFTLSSPETGDSVTGHVEKFSDTLVFVPDGELLSSTLYEARIDGGLSTPDGTALGEDAVFSFVTASYNSKGSEYFENASPIEETFLTSEAPLIAVMASGEYSKAALSIYRFPSGDAYADVLAKYAARCSSSQFPDREAPKVDTASLEHLGTFEEQELMSPSAEAYYYGPRYLPLPGDFAPGWYYVQVTSASDATGQTRTLHKLIQVSDLSVYYAQTNGSALLWLNSAGTGSPVADAEVTLTGGVETGARTDMRGTVLFETPAEEKTGAVLDIRAGEERFLELYDALAKTEPTLEEKYITYLYTDRPLYMSSDTVRVWGLVRPRMQGVEMPENLRVALRMGEDEFYPTPVELLPDGTFTAQLSFEKLGSLTGGDSYTLSLLCGEKDELDAKWINVEDFVKPAYVPSFTFDKVFYQPGDTAEGTFTATFFDETPAAGLSVNLSIYSLEMDTQIVTDAGGSGTTSFTIEDSPEPRTWWADEKWYGASNAGGENENFYINDVFPVFYRDLMLLGETDEETNALTIHTNEIAFSNITSREDIHDRKKLTGAAVDTDVTVEVYRRYYTSRETGSYYDFIQKRRIPSYSYDQHNDLVETRTVHTQNGMVMLTDLPRSDADSAYYCELRAADSKGRPVQVRAWLGFDEYFYGRGIDHYTFLRNGVTEDSDYRDQWSFGEETVYYDVRNNGRLVEGGSVLYAIAQRGFTKVDTSTSMRVSVPFDESLVPNYSIGGAYFDGKHVFEIPFSGMGFDPSGRELAIEISPDKEKYAPGDTAELDIAVAYPDGRPAADAAVSVGVVDEAVFAVREQYVETLEDLYSSIYYPEVFTFSSYIQYNFAGNGGAEKGGGGGESGVRRDFKNTADMLTATTDSDGHAHLSIALPDNITSWRATVQAVTPDLFAGDTRQALIVTGRFFINEVLADQYLSGDNAQVTLRAHGSGIDPDAMVDYTVRVASGTQVEEHTASGRAQEPTSIPLGTLYKGTYTVTMEAKSGEMQDAVERTVSVLNGGVEATVVSTFSLADGVSIDASRYPVTLGFYNEAYRIWARVLEEVSGAGGMRADERIARRYADDVMARMNDEEGSVPPDEDTLTDVIALTGSVKLFPYDSEDLELSTRAHLAAPEYLVGLDQTQVFTNALGSFSLSGGDQQAEALCYLGLAAHKKPVLTRVRAMLESGAVTERSRMYLAAALAALGDTDGAAACYRDYIRPRLGETTTADGEEALYIDMDGDINASLKETAIASLSASMTRSPDADKIMQYLLHNRSTEDLFLLEELVYLRWMQPQGKEKASVSYRRDGKTRTLDLGKMGMRFVRFVYEDFEQADIRQKNGNVGVKAFYTAGIRQVQQAAAGEADLRITRTMETTDGLPMRPGSIVRVVLEVQTGDERINPYQLAVSDYIPSGMRWLGMDYIGEGSDPFGKGSWSGWRNISRQGQRVNFLYDVQDLNGEEYDEFGNLIPPQPGEKTYPTEVTLTYYVRCAAPGDYVVDDAFARSQDGVHWGVGGAQELVTIAE